MTNNKCRIFTIIVLVFSFLIGCSKLYRKETTVVDPANVALIDQSRVDNMKIRHIVKEFLLKGIVDQEKEWLTVFDLDTLSKEYIQAEAIQYFISFDIMEYGISDIDMRTGKILVSVKIIKSQTDNILSSFIEDAVGNDLEQMCTELALKLSVPIVEKLTSFQKRNYQVPDVLTEPQDTIKTQE